MQMMLDLGDTADGISEKTGLSESTVRRRLKLLEYGRDVVTKAFEHGATFSDFEKLNEISDLAKREELAKTIGTSNFNYSYARACQDEKELAEFAKVKEIIESFAEEISEDEKQNYCYTGYVSRYSACRYEKPDNSDTLKYFYAIDKVGNISIYRERTPEEIKDCEKRQKEISDAEERKKRQDKKLAELQRLTETADKLRHDFIVKCNPLIVFVQLQCGRRSTKQFAIRHKISKIFVGFYKRVFTRFPDQREMLRLLQKANCA